MHVSLEFQKENEIGCVDPSTFQGRQSFNCSDILWLKILESNRLTQPAIRLETDSVSYWLILDLSNDMFLAIFN